MESCTTPDYKNEGCRLLAYSTLWNSIFTFRPGKLDIKNCHKEKIPGKDLMIGLSSVGIHDVPPKFTPSAENGAVERGGECAAKMCFFPIKCPKISKISKKSCW